MSLLTIDLVTHTSANCLQNGEFHPFDELSLSGWFAHPQQCKLSAEW